MRLTSVRSYTSAFAIFLFLASSLAAQRKTEKKYPALLWEISGNGLQKPSYLFGTMHVSSKLVFHLSDSFYLDIRSADVVALELDPQLWQDQLFRFQNMQNNLRFYTQGAPTDLINEKSFQLEKYDDRLKSSFSDEPTIINGLLYRTYQTRADFEEDTYLDLYIYQTGRKLGKQATGVENYFQTERLIMEAAQDMMKDKKKKAPDTDGQSASELERRTQEAYRRGDLDLLDSLERLQEPSESYMEKFLYRRNEIQATSIDSIVKKHSLFVGVGAAHLPGKRGVIELLRRKGYTLRPVNMPDKEANRRDDIDRIKVPVTFSTYTSDDGDFSVQLPGQLYRRPDSRAADSWQYADMSNGVYYLIGRVRTHSAFLGQKKEIVQRKVDSLLYENIPGKIIKKTAIIRDGFSGFDITSRTRRGDLQRYNILVTPFEVWTFKMSGNGSYVDGEEADRFFNSIRLRDYAGTKGLGSSAWVDFTPRQGGFNIRFPLPPALNKNNSGADGLTRWEYESADPASGDAFLLWKESVQNYRFLEEDTADLALMEESFALSDWIDKRLIRRTGLYNGYPSLDATYLAKDGSFIRTRFLLHGADYYAMAVRSRGNEKSSMSFFNGFRFLPYRHAPFRCYADSFVNISVTTPIVPEIDTGLRTILERATSDEFLNSLPDYNNYWPHPKTALFRDDSTGETIFVSAESFPKYYYPKDSIVFWQEEINEKKWRQDFVLRSKKDFRAGPVFGYQYILSDTNTSRQLHTWVFLKDARLFRVVSLDDTLSSGSEFSDRFYSTFHPLEGQPAPSVFSSKLTLFFHDFYSGDSLVAQRARDAVPNVYFGRSGVPGLLAAIRHLPYNGKDYFETKIKLINELGYINDSAAVTQVVAGLKVIYEAAGDTSTIQHAVLKALAHHKTSAAYDLLKEFLTQDPPVFDNASDYNYLFQDLGDSLSLAGSLFPALLPLAAVSDYKGNIQSLLASLVDSGYIVAANYESYFSQLYFDAKIQWKKQEGRDEKKMQKKEDDAADNTDNESAEAGANDLDDFAILLMPFYDINPTLPRFFDKLLQSRDASLRLSTAILLLRHGKPVADSILNFLAASDQYRSRLLRNLQNIHRIDRFPHSFDNQESIARSLLIASKGEQDFAAIQLVDKKMLQYKQFRGYVFFFRYKLKKDDEWQMGLSGLQPLNSKEVNTEPLFVQLTGKKIKSDSPALEQFQQQLKFLVFSKRKSAAAFYLDNDFYDGRGDED